ncbi:MAG: insulinase family protein [Ruminococcaceae bacterium]|nr:insulinase family protein [Oscillospiraceae bacterium]
MERIAEICGIEFYYVENNSFKSDTVAVNFCDRLDRERAYKNAVLPALLWRGCSDFPTSKDLTVKCQELFGTVFLTDVGKRSEIHHMLFMADFLKDEYVSSFEGGEDISEDFLSEESFKLILKVLTEPVTENNGFMSSYFEQECTNLNNDIAAEKNDKRHYAMTRAREIMFEGEAFAVSELGYLGDSEKLTAEDLYSYYKNYFLKKVPCRIFYCGKKRPDALVEMFKEAAETGIFGDGVRGGAYIDYVEKHYIPDSEVKFVTEECEISDGKLVMGFRTNTPQDSDGFFPLVLMNTVYGGGTSSKLFTNVREKNSLAYYAGSRVSAVKGVMFVSAGISPDKFDTAKAIILEQLDEIKKGNITDEEFEAAKKNIINNLKNMAEDQYALLDYYLDQSFLNRSYTLDEYIANIEKVKKEQLPEVAKRIQLDTVFFLKGTKEDNDE